MKGEDLRELGKTLHNRLLAERSQSAAVEIAETFLPLLSDALKHRFASLRDPHLAETAAIDALLSYMNRPARFDPSQSSLIGYLYMVAYRDLIDMLRREKKSVELQHPLTEYEMKTLTQTSNPEKRLIEEGSMLIKRMRALVSAPVDREMVALMMDGVRDTAAYAEALGIQHLPFDEQAAIVKRHKDRLKAALRRAMDELRHIALPISIVAAVRDWAKAAMAKSKPIIAATSIVVVLSAVGFYQWQTVRTASQPSASSSRLGIGATGLTPASANLLLPASPIPQSGASFVLTGSMAVPRDSHEAVLLPNGRVLVAGGHPQNINCASTSSAEIYDPVLGTWAPTGSMNRPRYDFTLTLLGNGKVLAVGGAICGGGVNNTAELYDPSTGTWEYTGNMTFHRSSHSAVLLTEGVNAGKVLVIGGDNGSGFAVNTAELYDPTTGTWTATGSLNGIRTWPQAVVLNDGRVLVTSGQIPNVMPLATCELYDPDIGSWTPTDTLSVARDGFHRATVLANGEVLLTGGSDWNGTLMPVERYNPATGLWTLVSSMLQQRSDHTATRLSNGRVLVTGGYIGSTFLQSAEFYDPMTDSWSVAGSLNEPRENHTATVLQNGQVLLAGGGIQYAVVTGGSELYIPCALTNDPPAIASVTGPTDPVSLGSTPSVTVNYTDNTAQNHTVGISWNDGTPDTIISVNTAEANGSVTASHAYAAAGVYTITATVTDDCGASAIFVYQFIVIYDPNGGFVTGGGWINSAPGSYVANPSIMGKATFGFVSKYQRGASIPSGNTEFQFHGASFNFKSTIYEWLVVAGAKAQYKGTGKVNGTGEYGFLLTVTDGQRPGGGGTDKFRIKIWDKATGQVVYDNRLGSSDNADDANPQAIGGGSIVIHSQ